MEGSGVIDLDRLYEERKLFGFYAEQLSYPEEENLYPGILDDYLSEDHPSYDLLLEYLTQIEHKTLYERQKKYTETHDFQKDCRLFMMYVKFEDSKGRGLMLARLEVLYAVFGLERIQGGLADLVPLVCEFVEVAEWKRDPRA